MIVEGMSSASFEGGNFLALHCWAMQKVKLLQNVRFFFV